MELARKQELEALLEFSTVTGIKIYHAEYDDKTAILTFAYGTMLDLTDPDARAFYDSFLDMERESDRR